MRYRIIDDERTQTFLLVFQSGDEVISVLQHFAEENSLDASHFTAIGAFSRVTLGFFDTTQKCYLPNKFDEQLEVVSLVGNIALQNNRPQVHAHAVVANSKAQAFGGHLLEAYIRPTLEVILTETPRLMRRTYDPDTGLALLDSKPETSFSTFKKSA